VTGVETDFRPADRGCWARHGGTFVRGRAFRDGRPLDAAGIAALVAGAEPDALPGLLAGLNGFFAVVRRGDDRIDVAVDHVRSRPLFYAVHGGRVVVSDDASRVCERLPAVTWDPLAEVEFSTAGVVTGADTLYREISGVQAGEVVTVRGGDGGPAVATDRHARFDYAGTGARGDAGELLDALDSVATAAFERLLRVADGRTIAVPLSGGYDSRLVASMLVRLGADDVVTFTFGRAGNREAAVSRRVASALDLPWEFVEYTPERWREWYGGERRRAYYRRAYDYCSVPSVTAWPAVGELVSEGRLPADAVVVSGDGVVTLGEHVPASFGDGAVSREEFVDALLDVQFGLWEAEPTAAALLRERLGDRFAPGPGEDPVAALQRFDWAERQAKFIVSPEEFADWGLDWWLPLFDREYVDFWERVPLALVREKRLHRRYVDRIFEEVAGDGRAAPGTADGGGLTDAVKARVASSPLSSLVSPVYERLRGDGRDRHPTAGFGFVPRAQFDGLATGGETVHSFKVLELLGRASFDPPRTRDPPVDGLLDFERSAPERVDPGAFPWLCGDTRPADERP